VTGFTGNSFNKCGGVSTPCPDHIGKVKKACCVMIGLISILCIVAIFILLITFSLANETETQPPNIDSD
jgi:hypothetical protein